MRYVSKENPIPSVDFGANPYLSQKGMKRAASEEEVARDLIKDPRQILADIHDESLDRNRPPEETISRSVARLASLQLKNNELSKASNELMKWIAIFGFGLAIISFGYSVYANTTKTNELEQRMIELEHLHKTLLLDQSTRGDSRQETTP